MSSEQQEIEEKQTELTEQGPSTPKGNAVSPQSQGGLIDTQILAVGSSNNAISDENNIQPRQTRYLWIYYQILYFVTLLICGIWGFLGFGLLSIHLAYRIVSLFAQLLYTIQNIFWKRRHWILLSFWFSHSLNVGILLVALWFSSRA